MLKIRGVVILAAVDWNFLRQRVHHLAAGMAGEGLKVLFVENTAVRSPRMADLPRILQRMQAAFIRPADKCIEPVPENLVVYSPLAVPYPYNAAAVAWNYALLRWRVEKFLREEKLHPEEVLLLTYLSTPLVLRMVKNFPWALVAYDVVSDPKIVAPRLAPFEGRLLGLVDVTVFASATLMELYSDRSKHSVLFRDGFNTELRGSEVEIPPEVAHLPRPRLLYIGGINRKLCIEAIAATCEAVPNGSVILMGPIARSEVVLPKLPNLHVFPTRRRYVELAGVLRAADMGLIPYRPDAYAGAMHPAKLNEYLVFGLPVVATATEELERFARELPKRVVFVANGPEDFAQLVREVLNENTADDPPDGCLSNMMLSWDMRARDFLQLIQRRGAG